MPVSNAKFLQDIYKYYPKISKLMQENIEKNKKELEKESQYG